MSTKYDVSGEKADGDNHASIKPLSEVDLEGKNVASSFFCRKNCKTSMSMTQIPCTGHKPV